MDRSVSKMALPGNAQLDELRSVFLSLVVSEFQTSGAISWVTGKPMWDKSGKAYNFMLSCGRNLANSSCPNQVGQEMTAHAQAVLHNITYRCENK